MSDLGSFPSSSGRTPLFRGGNIGSIPVGDKRIYRYKGIAVYYISSIIE